MMEVRKISCNPNNQFITKDFYNKNIRSQVVYGDLKDLITNNKRQTIGMIHVGIGAADVHEKCEPQVFAALQRKFVAQSKNKTKK